MISTAKDFLLCLLLLTVSFSNTIRSQRRFQLPPSRREIPAASLTATPEEAAWWTELKTAGEAVRGKRDGKKERQRFMDLLQKGQEQSLKPPVPDTKIIVLSRTEPKYTEAARRDLASGRVIMRVECRADGFVGDVEILRGIRSDLDENAVEAARRITFLPAVRNRTFVTERIQMEMNFNIY